MGSQVAKLTISLPRDLLSLADEIAAERKISRSKLVYQCLQELSEQRLNVKMAEGYRALSKSNLEFADQAINLAHEILPD
jgi:metal-responsive CopG/Arc/MetJ family transcriptional regulator